MAIKTSPYRPEDLRELAGQLRRVLESVEEAIEWTEKNDSPLFVFNRSSQVDGVKRFRGFERELTDSLIAAKAGRPYTAETLKPRASATVDDEMIAQGSERLAAIERKAKSKKKIAGNKGTAGGKGAKKSGK